MSSAGVARAVSESEPLTVLFEDSALPACELPEELVALYGGGLGFSRPELVASVIGSLDGVPTRMSGRESRALVRNRSDRFIRGLLRACADAILIGAGALRAGPSRHWTPEDACAAAAPLYARLRRLRGLPPRPMLAVVSGGGDLDPRHPALAERALVLTSEQGAARLDRRLPGRTTIVPIGDQAPLDPALAVEALRLGGHELILCEGGPTLFRSLTTAGLVAELFLTLSPVVAGFEACSPLTCPDGLSRPLTSGRLVSLRQSGSYLFLRYVLPRTGAAEP